MSLLKLTDYKSSHICICRACHHDVDQNSGKPGYVPRYIKFSNKGSTVVASVQKCNVKGCSNQADIKSTDCLNFEDTLPDIVFTLPENTALPHLCSPHYYQHQNPVNCKTCNAKPKPFNRHCPNPTVVEKYLRATQGYSGSIHDNDVVCYRCYKQQSELLDTLKLFNLPTTQVLSLDSELDEVIHAVMKRLQISEQESEEYAVLSTVLMVGSAMKEGQCHLTSYCT